MGDDTTMRVKRVVKERMLNLDFVKRQTDSEIVEKLIDFYERNSGGGNGK